MAVGRIAEPIVDAMQLIERRNGECDDLEIITRPPAVIEPVEGRSDQPEAVRDGCEKNQEPDRAPGIVARRGREQQCDHSDRARYRKLQPE